MSIPAPFRDVIQQRAGDRRVILTPHRGDWDCLEGRTTDHAARINEAQGERYAADEVSVESEMARIRAFSLSLQLQFEESGRMVVPEDMREIAEIEDVVLFTGLGDYFQLWKPELFISDIADAKTARILQKRLDKVRGR
ncbi:MAG: hypothetical protein V2J26_04230 [Pacificimonas sp.]|nr:hypothetical protein [Pacificimonas sp.]